jgi:ATP-dependent DNA helicase DinG
VWQGGLAGALDGLLAEVELLHDGLRLVRERLETDDRRLEALAPLLAEVRAVARRSRPRATACAARSSRARRRSPRSAGWRRAARSATWWCRASRSTSRRCCARTCSSGSTRP